MIHTFINVVRGFLSGDGALILPEMELVLFACGILLIDRWLSANEKIWNALLALAGTSFSEFTLYVQHVKMHADERRFGLWVCVVIDEESVPVVVRAAREANVGAIVAGNAARVVVPAEVAPILVVAESVSESVSGSVDVLTLIRLEEVAARVRADDLESRHRLLV